MANILITGSNGQLGSELKILLSAEKRHTVFFTDLPRLDISDNMAVSDLVEKNNINAIVNCAAYTAVDKAEEEPEICFKINGEAPGTLAAIAAKYSALLIHISTDYVFDGLAHSPYTEDSVTNPSGVYGKSKMEGENRIANSSANYIIVRTSWLYSAFGNNFAKTILKLSSEKDIINVVYDQIGTPTYAADLAKTVVAILNRNLVKNNILPPVKVGIYNYSNEGVCSWYDFAVEIVKMAGHKCRIIPVTGEVFKQKARRPAFSLLDKTKIKDEMNITIPHWRESLEEFFKVLNNN